MTTEESGSGVLERARRWLAEVPASLRRAVVLVGFAGCVALLGYVLDRTVRGAHFNHLNGGAFAVSLLGQAVYFVLLGLGWAALIGDRSRLSALASWSRTQALHLLPGGVLTPATRALTVEGPARRRAAAVATESLMQIGTSFAVAGVAMAVGYSPVWALLVLGLPACLGLATLAHLFGQVDLRHIVAASCWYLAARIAYCASAVFAQGAIGPVAAPWKIAGVAAMAWVAGLVVFFAPGGLGVREAVYVSMLTGVMATGALSAGALCARVVSTVAELVVLLAVGWFARTTPTTTSSPRAASG